MQSIPTDGETSEPAPQPPEPAASASDPKAAEGAVPIGEWVTRPDFPQCALGQMVEIRGQAGLVVAIRNNSIKVRSPDGSTQSFNYLRLRTLYAPAAGRPAEPEHPDSPPPQPPSEPEGTAAEDAPTKRPRIEEPDFTLPVRGIKELVGQPDFPDNAYGQHMDLGGFTGVVVDIVGQSLKVRSAEGTTRSYNAMLLKKLHAGK